MTDAFKTFGDLTAPATSCIAVVPSDTNPIRMPAGGFGELPRALYVGGVGDITLITAAGETVLFKAVPAGTILPVRATQVKQTGTTATFILALQ